jgi:hypothetical protein
MMGIPLQTILNTQAQSHNHKYHRQKITQEIDTHELPKEFLYLHGCKDTNKRAKNKAKAQKNKKKQRLFSTSFYFYFIFCENGITFRGSRQKQLTSYDLWRDVQPIRGDHSWWPFSHGSRAYLRDGDCAAEMFSSLLFTIYLLLFQRFGVQKYSFLLNYARNM